MKISCFYGKVLLLTDKFGEMRSAPKYSRISTISRLLKKRGTVIKLHILFLRTLNEKNKEATNLLSKKRNELFRKNIIAVDKNTFK